MRGYLVVLALAMSVTRASHAQVVTSTSNSEYKQCLQRQRGNPSDTGAGSRADPTVQGNKSCTPPTVGVATISGSVFFDITGDGIFDPDEVGISGWQVQITGPVSQTAMTDGSGAFSFTGLASGSYMLCVLAPAGWNQISPSTGAGCPSGMGYSIVVPTLAADTTYTRTFGFVSQ
jgi:hypothetical protein